MHLRKTLVIINILLFAMLIYCVTRPGPETESSKKVPGPSTTESGRLQPAESVSAREIHEKDYEQLTEADLFDVNEEEAETQERATDEKSAEPGFQLDMKLMGTVAGDTDLARAIIQTEGEGRQKLYSAGDRVSGAKIAEISRKKVLLEYDNTHYRLTMDAAEAAQRTGEEDEKALAKKDFQDTVTSGHNGTIKIDRQAALEEGGGMFAMIHEARKNLEARPYMENDEAIGLELQGVDELGIAELAGIEDGDVLRSVNGEDIASVSEAMRIFRETRHRDNVDLKLLRGEEEVQLNYKIE